MATRTNTFLPLQAERLAWFDESARLAIRIPLMICVTMLGVGLFAGYLANIDGSGLFMPYTLAATSLTVISFLIYIFFEVLKMAMKGVKRPTPLLWQKIRAKAPFLVLPTLIFPFFLTGFTTAKSSIPALVGYRWDAFWADADVIIFGTDAWRITHSIFHVDYMGVWGFLYATAWFLTLGLFKANVAIYSSPRRIGIIYTAMLGTWLLGGFLFAYCFSAAGPILAHLFDASLADRFEPLRNTIYNSPGGGGAVRQTQEYLSIAMYSSIAVKGGGISAMPSMHIGATTIYILAARGTKWLGPAIAYWIIIFFFSAYFGWHYWVDAIVAVAIAWLCWSTAETIFKSPAANEAACANDGSSRRNRTGN
jgi:hypothetical protein